MRKTMNGFTIVELLIVIVVIAILASISVVAYNGIQSRARDADRMNDLNVMKKGLALFHAENGYYPARPEFFDANFRRNSLNIPDSAVNPPGTNNTIGYCWSGGPNQYCYVPTPPSGGSFDCGTSGERCIGYRISYHLESAPTTQRVMSSN